jgi:predicted nuclease of restriction endonuclease-like (RecB) superfamily
MEFKAKRGFLMKTTRTKIDPKSYAQFIEKLKTELRQAQLRAALSVTKELTSLYWRIGRMLPQKISDERWGNKTIERISKDIGSLFPNMKSFSSRNLHFMRQFAESYPNGICETAVSQLPWGHNIILMQKVKDPSVRLWYAIQALANGWSRGYLEECIKN